MESFQPPILYCFRADLARVKEVLASHPSDGRTALARHLCEAFGFYTATGALRTSSCLHALTVLDGEGKIKLPPSTRRPDCPNARSLSEPVPAPTGVPNRIRALKGLQVERVRCLATLTFF